jgi:tRNA-dihydrouridine synthase A
LSKNGFEVITRNIMTTASTPGLPPLSRRLSVAPMMDWTDRHDRFFLRLIAPRALLYTEMVTTGAIKHGDRQRLLGFNPEEQPLALQLGGSDPAELASSAKIGEQWGYSEINLNVGCPSDRVQSGRFGACLMADPTLVAECVGAMRAAVDVDVTVKHRIGIDGRESYDQLADFVGTVAEAGCASFTVHARIAILAGLSPKENRDIPPLKYDWVYRLKRDFPQLEITINGGIKTGEAISEHLAHTDGVMIGREAYHNPWFMVEAEERTFGPCPDLPENREAVVERLIPYIERETAAGTPLSAISRHILGLFAGLPGGRAWRRHLSENAFRPGAGVAVVRGALAALRTAAESVRAGSMSHDAGREAAE